MTFPFSREREIERKGENVCPVCHQSVSAAWDRKHRRLMDGVWNSDDPARNRSGNLPCLALSSFPETLSASSLLEISIGNSFFFLVAG